MPINKAWHEDHRMPHSATTQQRITWQLEHARESACRPIPPKLLDETNRQQRKEGDLL